MIAGLLLAVGVAVPWQDEAAEIAGRAFALVQQDPLEALASLERAFVLAGGDRPDVLQAMTFARLWIRDLDAAIAHARRAQAAAPDDPYPWVWVGDAEFWREDLDAAGNAYEEALRRAGTESLSGEIRGKIARIDEERGYRARLRALRARTGIAVLVAFLFLAGGVALVRARAR